MSRQELAGNNNQVPPGEGMGYKKSAIGLIPEDWEVTIIDEVTSEVGDGLHATPLYSDQGNYYFINGNNLVDSKIYVDTITQKCDQSEAKKYQQRLNQRTILLSINGTIGNLAFYQGEPVILGKSVAYLNPTKNISKNYLYYQLQTQTIKNFFRNGLTGTTIFNLGLGTIRKTPIAIPPLPEQKAIASVLSDVDELISSLDKLIAKKRHIKTATMQQLLTGKTRLPGFGEGKGYKKSAKGMGYKKSAIGLIPEDWEVKLLPEIAWFQEGPGVRNYQFAQSGVKLLNGTNIFRGQLTLDTTNRYISVGEAFGSYKHFLVDVGDILIASSGITIDKFHEKLAFALPEHLPLCMNTSTIRFKANCHQTTNQYLYFFLQSDLFKAQIGKQATGSAQLNFGPAHLNKVSVVISQNSEEQKAIASVLSDMDKEIAALEKRRAKTQGIKQGMMQELLTGRTRIINNYNGE